MGLRGFGAGEIVWAEGLGFRVGDLSGYTDLLTPYLIL